MTDKYFVSLDEYCRNEFEWLSSCSNIPKSKQLHDLVSDGIRIKDMRDILRVQRTEQSELEKDEGMNRFIKFLPKFLSLEEEVDEDVDFFTDEIVEHLLGMVTYLLDNVLPSLGVISERSF